MNIPLMKLRIDKRMTQDEFGKYIGGYEGHTIMRIEKGISAGKLDFWKKVQEKFNIPDEQMWHYQLGIVKEDQEGKWNR